MVRFLTLAVLLALPARVGAQEDTRLVAGRVRDHKARKIAGAEVLDAERRLLGTSDRDGWFSVRLPAEAQSITFRRIGYKPAAFAFPKGWGLTDTVSVILTEAAQVLADLEVEAKAWKPVRYAGTTKYDDLFRRQRVGLGWYLSRADLDRRPAIQTLELLQGIPGVRVTIGPPGLEWGNNIKITRCTGSSSKVNVYVDGARLIGAASAPAQETYAVDPNGSPFGPRGKGSAFGSGGTPRDVIEKLNRIPPSDIEMIEVYRGASQLPAEFHDDGCAAIVVWTRWNAPVETRDSSKSPE